jgi:hypothetical protein
MRKALIAGLAAAALTPAALAAEPFPRRGHAVPRRL